MIRTLAEPNLTAISGEAANFLAGGEFPIVAGVSCQSINQCTPTVEFKKYGISLAFSAGGAVGGPHQPEGHDRGFGALDRRRDREFRLHHSRV